MEKICYNCFAESLDEKGVCTKCGFDVAQNQKKFHQTLPYGTILFGRYIVGRTLRKGGFGITYLAQDYQTKELVEIREYFPEFLARRTEKNAVTVISREYREKFADGLNVFFYEASVMAKFRGNPNFTQVDTYFEENNTGYLVMEHQEGQSFADYIQSRGGRLDWKETMKVISPVMDALEIMHEKNVIHRNITPEFIFMTKDGVVKLPDFGEARYRLYDLSNSAVLLERDFAPPEEYASSSRKGPFTDVYFLGATIYYAITGRKPEDALDRMDGDGIIFPTRLGMEITDRQEQVMMRALALKADERYQTIAQFREALAKVQNRPAEKPEEASVKSKQKIGNTQYPVGVDGSSGGPVPKSQKEKEKTRLFQKSTN